MWKLFNFKADKRTLMNVCKFPVILFVSVPVGLLLMGIEWLNDWTDIVHDKLPRWDPY